MQETTQAISDYWPRKVNIQKGMADKPNLNYLSLINAFWSACPEAVPSHEVHLYFKLLDICNNLNWKNPFGYKDALLYWQVGLSNKTFKIARDGLVKRGLIAHVPGHKSLNSTYEILIIDRRNSYQSTKLEGDIPSNNLLEGISPINNQILEGETPINKPLLVGKIPNYNKTETKTKTKTVCEAQAPTHPPEFLNSFSELNTWIGENAPDVLRMQEPFTIEQFVSIQNQFPNKQQELKQVLLAMHNFPNLLKTKKSALLTIQAWLPNEKLKQQPADKKPKTPAEIFLQLAREEKAAKSDAEKFKQEQEDLIAKRELALYGNYKCAVCETVYNVKKSCMCPNCGTKKIVMS